MAQVRFDRATRHYAGSERAAVDALDLEVQDGELLVLVGPSGCGKSTALRMLAGLEPVDAGAVHVGERDVTRVPSQLRDIAMVFQDYALYPHMTVEQNIGFPLKIARRPAAERTRRVAEAARLLALDDVLRRRPAQLSGGQRQRVAMGRAVVREPQAFLLDEPLSNLDAKLRGQTRAFIADLQRRLGTTTVYVTHDQVEAMTMGHRVAVLSDGVLQQVDTPQRIYARPVNTFVAGFVGAPPMNLLERPLSEAGVAFGEQTIAVGPDVRAEGSTVVLGLRAEQLELARDAPGLDASVVLVEHLGADALVHARPRGEEAPLVVRCDPEQAPAPGQPVVLRANEARVHLFSPTTGLRLAAVAQPV